MEALRLSRHWQAVPDSEQVHIGLAAGGGVQLEVCLQLTDTASVTVAGAVQYQIGT